MSTGETQKLILQKAVELFNARGIGRVSNNKIADLCGISRGHLHYHFKNKNEIVRAIFAMIIAEMNSGWYLDHLTPTVPHTIRMFDRQLALIWRYRFFYRELAVLLDADEILSQRFRRDRDRRIRFIKNFFIELQNAELFHTPANPEEFDCLVLSTFLISDHWLNFSETYGLKPGETRVRQGYSILLAVLRPHFTPKALRELPTPSEHSFDLGENDVVEPSPNASPVHGAT
jgi:AcrR family transcriptional regulator